MAVLKKMKTPSMLEFNRILDRLSHEDSIGHLFIVDIKFHNKNPKTMLFNEIFPPVFEKNKTVRAHDRSTVQLMSVLNRNKQRDIIIASNALPKLTLPSMKKKSFLCMPSIYIFDKKGRMVSDIYLRTFHFRTIKI